MKTMRPTATALFALALSALTIPANAAVHIWEKQELTFAAAGHFTNPYTEVKVWVDLSGPHFKKRVYGFWDGGNEFRVRVVATEPGEWRWTSGSDPEDKGLAGKSGSFTATPWSDDEKRENPLRRGFLRPTANGHALELADGTPFLVTGDTWYSVGTNRFKWHDDDRERRIGPEAGFKDYVRLRKSQGYNWINMIAAFPNWMTDGQPWHVVMNDPEKTTVRSAWLEFGTGSAKNMDNEGGRPFLFPGKVPGYENMFPDVDRINPDYFRYIDRKIDYLNQQGFVVVHRSVAPRRQSLLEEVLRLAAFLRALYRIHLGALPGQQCGAQPHPPRHHQRDRRPAGIHEGHSRSRWTRTGRRPSERFYRRTPTRPRWRTGASAPG